jgi:AcrR family transcriptional regulator
MSNEKRRYELKARAEKQERTREAIVEATAALHEEVGPAQTTIAEVARRAGVQRLTVYNHFPEEKDLFQACQKHFLTLHPPPDVSEPMSDADPIERLRGVLASVYKRYRVTQAMTENIQRDRARVPALDELLRATGDARSAELADTLAQAFAAPKAARKKVRATIALALDYWTWRRLTLEGLDDDAAADLMVDAVTSVVGGG